MKLSTLLKRSVAVLGGGCLLLVGWAGLELVRPLPDDHLDRRPTSAPPPGRARSWCR